MGSVQINTRAHQTSHPTFPHSFPVTVMDVTTASPTPHHVSERTETSSAFPSRLSVSSSQVKKQLERLKHNKAAGPGGVNRRILQACVE